MGRSKRPLRYYVSVYKWKGKTVTDCYGWEKTPQDKEIFYRTFLELKANRKNRTAPFSLAELREDNERVALEDQRKKDLLTKQNISFSAAFELYLPYSKSNKKSIKSWKREEQLNRIHISPVLKETPLRKISSFHLELIKKNMTDAELSPRSIRYALAVVRQVFNFAINHNLFDGKNPAAGKKVARPREDNKRQRFLTKKEAELLLDELKKRSIEVHDMALFAMFTGARFGEIAKLKWIDVDLHQKIVMFRKTKSEKDRFAPIIDRVKTMLIGRGIGQGNQLVFPARGTNKPHSLISSVYYDTVRNLFNKDISDKKMWVNFHTLRHTCASWLVEGNTNIYLVKELLGHSSIILTERYAHFGDNQLKMAVLHALQE